MESVKFDISETSIRCILQLELQRGKEKSEKKAYGSQSDGCQGKAKAGSCGEAYLVMAQAMRPSLSFSLVSKVVVSCLTLFLCNDSI